VDVDSGAGKMEVERVGGVKGSGCGGRARMLGWWCWGKLIGGEYVESWTGRVDFSGTVGGVFLLVDFDLDFRDIRTPMRSRIAAPRNHRNTYVRCKPGKPEDTAVSERTGMVLVLE
jgi:hypothetical protein